MSDKHVFEFKLRRVMMYNHRLFVQYGKHRFEAIAEDSPDANLGLLVWPADFGLEEIITQKLVTAFGEWATREGIKYTICDGRRCG